MKFLFSATNAHGIHSPFVFQFYNKIIKDESREDIFHEIETIRKEAKRNDKIIDIIDFGQGSKAVDKNQRTISSIAKSSISFPYQCRVMHRVVKIFNPEYILELGTSLGISTSYIATGNSKSKVWTLEGDHKILEIAEKHFDKLKIKNIRTIKGPFIDTLSITLHEMKKVDLVFMDGHHQKQATIDYFETILPYCNNESIIIIDDIYWSKEMQEAWKTIKNMPEVSLTINLFFCGIVFFRKENKAKEHFNIRPKKLFFYA